MEEIEFENFIEPLREALDGFRKASKEKKQHKTNDSKGGESNEHDDMNESTILEIPGSTEIEE